MKTICILQGINIVLWYSNQDWCTSIGTTTWLCQCQLSIHWGRVMHIYVNNLTIVCSGNGLPPGRRQPIIWTNAGLLLIEPLGTNFSEILIEIYTFSFKKMHLKMSGKCRPFHLGPNVLKDLGKIEQNQGTHCFTVSQSKYKIFLSWKCIWKFCQQNGGHFVLGSIRYKHSSEADWW